MCSFVEKLISFKIKRIDFAFQYPLCEHISQASMVIFGCLVLSIYFFKFNLELKIIGQLVTKFENNIIVKYEWIKHKKENKLKVRLLTCKDFLSPTVQSYAVYCHTVFCFVLFFWYYFEPTTSLIFSNNKTD